MVIPTQKSLVIALRNPVFVANFAFGVNGSLKRPPNFISVNGVGLVLLFAIKFVAIQKRGHRFNKRTQREWVGERNHRPDFRRGGDFRHNYKDLSDIEKASIDSLKGLFIKGDRENNMIVMKQIKGIIKQ